MQLRDMGDCTHIWELQCTLAVYTAFKTESNAIEFAKGELDNMDAGLQFFFPSNAVWLPPGRSTCFQACCK